MKYSLNWIKEYTSISDDLSQFLDKMAIDGFETEGIEDYDLDPSIVVARIDNFIKHPNADELNLCEVLVKENKYQIICGAQNLQKDMLVALAQIGSMLPNGLKITKRKIRGEISEGMICSASELGIAEKESSGILDMIREINFPKVKIEEGGIVRDILGLPDKVVDFNITPDCGYVLSHFGLAQEIAILNSEKCIKPLKKNVEISDKGKDFKINVSQDAKKGCPKYLLRSISSIKTNQKTPLFISDRLVKLGINCVNPVVDILNYVMIECGQPMHAFDADKVTGEISIKFSHSDNQKMRLINQDTVTIKQDSLLICDEKSPIALAGVMGSFDSAVQSTTTNILLECAYFDSVAIAGKARYYGLYSDAAYRYERGVDFNLPEIAMERATSLIVEFLSGEVSEVFSAISESHLPSPEAIKLPLAKVNQVLGTKLQNEEIISILSRINDVRHSEQTLTFFPPSHRFDLRIYEDLIEEVVRIYGYEKIKSNSLKVLSNNFDSSKFNYRRIRDFFVDRRFNEVINFSFISKYYHNIFHPNITPIELDNPISIDKSIMRYSLLAGLVDNYLQNKKYQIHESRFFEIGTCFSKTNDNLFKESQEIAGLIAGKRFQRNWANDVIAADFYDLKGDLEAFFTLVGAKVSYLPESGLNIFHPHQSAKIIHNKKIIGYVGYLNPLILTDLDIKETILFFELNLESILNKPTLKFKNFSRYPQVKRDLALLIDEKVSSNNIIEFIQALNFQDLISCQVFDVYQEKNSTQKSIGIELCFQSEKKTLKDEVVQRMLQMIIDQLKQKLSVKMRDLP